MTCKLYSNEPCTGLTIEIELGIRVRFSRPITITSCTVYHTAAVCFPLYALLAVCTSFDIKV